MTRPSGSAGNVRRARPSTTKAESFSSDSTVYCSRTCWSSAASASRSSTTTDGRRAHGRALIQRYVDGLGDNGIVYDVQRAWQDYLLAGLYNWCYVSVVAGTLDSSNARAFAWMSQMVARQAAFTNDHNLIELLPA